MKVFVFLAILYLAFLMEGIHAQPKEHFHKADVWTGLFCDIKLNQNFSIWNDFQFVPKSLFVSRHGLNWHFSDKLDFTAGYAWSATATSFSDKLLRQEHRPWGQMEFILPSGQGLFYRFRFRYEYRIRKRVDETEVFDDYIQYSRLRFLYGIRFPLLKTNKDSINLQLMNETLLNFGRPVRDNNLDQIRVWVLFVYPFGESTLMGGYVMRFLPGTNRNYFRHGLAVLYNIRL